MTHLQEEFKQITSLMQQTKLIAVRWVYFLTKLQHLTTPKLRYYESRYSEIRDIVNKCQLPQFFIPYTVTI